MSTEGEPTRLDDLVGRLERLEAIEEIGRLKARYCDACDRGYDADDIAALFTPDGIWDGGSTFGRVEGREQIRRHFHGAGDRISIARHQVMNPIITVDDDGRGAQGQWLLFQPCTDARTGGAMWLAATYHDRYERHDEGWLIAETVIDVAFFTPYERGWAEQRFPG